MTKTSELPLFKYHPNPLYTGSIVEEVAVCECCGQHRGFIYRGPIYSEAEVENICPWCIADGSAHAKWNAEFTDASGVGGCGSWGEVPSEVVSELAHRTVGFTAFQESRWWTHCGDAAEFLGIEEDRVKFRCRVCGKRGSYRDLD